MTGYRDEVEGVCTAYIHYGSGEAYKTVELTYYAVDYEEGFGYTVHVTRPEVTGAIDVMYDVIQALHADGIPRVKEVLWL